MATVKLTNVKKIYGKNTVAVQDFNLDIADKEFIVFVGPSGCGKSTTLRMIAGLEEISGGTVEIDGRVVNDLQPKDRDIAMVFQNYALYPHLTVFENMAFALRLKRIPETDLKPATEQAEEVAAEANSEAAAAEGEQEKKKEKPVKMVKIPEDEIYRRVTEAAEILGISEYLLRRPRELSGGQRQRVAIGRAMVRDSKVFLMDEPLSNLDAKLRNQMRAEIILLRKKIDTTFIYVTHDQTEAMTLGDRIVIMKDGFIQQVGTPTEVFDMPKNLFVAEFIGAPKMNTFTTELTKDKKSYFVEPFGVKIPVDGEKGELLAAKGVESQKIILGVRPEHITLTNRNNPAAIPCVIQVNEMMGSELHLHVVTETGEPLVVRVPTVQLTAAQVSSLVAGARIYITFRGKVMHFFNEESQLNLLVEQEAPAEEQPAETLAE
ncbi:MAG: ATP-binding cassette domain-containing protein [Clostridiales bacterium]|nr:ATP-binding cassette domain-containing protein [Clostridiales bacterium]